MLGLIGAGRVPELVVINKADAADPIDVEGLRLKERGSVVISAATGAGLDELAAALEQALPQRDREVRRWCLTAGVIWSPGPIRRVRCWPCGTGRTAPS